jgi:hypothetical protein
MVVWKKKIVSGPLHNSIWTGKEKKQRPEYQFWFPANHNEYFALDLQKWDLSRTSLYWYFTLFHVWLHRY